MPKKTNPDTAMAFDLEAFYKRTGLSAQQVADGFGVARSTLWRFEKDGKVPKVYLWALVGLERVYLPAPPPPPAAPVITPTVQEIAAHVIATQSPPPPVAEPTPAVVFPKRAEQPTRPAVLPEDFDEIDARISAALGRSMGPADAPVGGEPEELSDEFGPLDPNEPFPPPPPEDDEFLQWAKS